MEIHLKANKLDLELPVIPESFEIQDQQNNETVTIYNSGEINLLGKTGLRTITLSTLWPRYKYSWSKRTSLRPYQAMKLLKSWKDNNVICQLFITDTDIRWNVSIEKMTYSESDATGDINYTLELKEYKTLKRRVTKITKTIKYTVKKGDTLKKIAYKYLGASKYSKKIYSQNKRAIEKALKNYVKKYNKKVKKYNRKHHKKKKKLKWKNSSRGKRLIVGTKLVIKGK